MHGNGEHSSKMKFIINLLLNNNLDLIRKAIPETKPVTRI